MMAQQPAWLTRFIDTYQSLGTEDFACLGRIYHPQVNFRDPLHHIEGLNALIAYFERLYTHVSHCEFTIEHVLWQGDEAALYWQMRFVHSKLNGGQVIVVSGHSQLQMRDDLVIAHRDYFDVGEMLYQHIPLLGAAIRVINQRAIG